MKLENREQGNYSAVVVEIKNVIPFENCDNVHGVLIFGFQCVVSKDTGVGSIGLFFPAETQLSEEYCKQNNLYRHPDFNQDPEQKGYLEDNRRIKAVKFRGNRSDGLFMPLSSLDWTGINSDELKIGDEFDFVNGKEVCKKYVRKTRANGINNQPKAKRFNRVDPEFFPEHFKTDHFFKYVSDLDPETNVIVSQKLHGTSIRIANTKVKKQLSFKNKIAKLLGVDVSLNEYDYIFGSRKVVKDPANKEQNHFYSTDIWSFEGEKLRGLIPENYMLFGELIGWTADGAPIQSGYTYGIEQNKCELYIYRVAFINDRGLSHDLSWNQMQEFCKERGLKVVPEIWTGKIKDLNVSQYLDKRLFDEGHRACLHLGEDKKIVDEGVVVRIERRVPYMLKAKSPIFLEFESKILDQDLPDMEEDQVV